MSGETDNNNALEEGQEQNIENHDSEDTSSDQQQQQQQKIIKEKKHDAGAADLERVTDYAEEREISESDISGVMGLIGQEVAGRLQREKELSKIHINKDDIELLVNEFELTSEKAEQVLREHEGMMTKALITLTN